MSTCLVVMHRCALYLYAMGKYVTITDIARQLGISHATVSRALNDHPKISEKTIKEVKALAQQLGYLPNAGANQLSKGSCTTIALIVPDLSIHFFTRIIESIQEALDAAGYFMMLFNTSESLQKEIKATENCLLNRVGGVLAAISIETKSFEHFEKLLKHEVPLVFFDRVVNFLPVPKVTANDYQAAYNATNYLIKSGCNQIAHITGSINLNNSNNRLYGYLDALRDSHIQIEESLIHYYAFELASIDRFIINLLKTFPYVDGLFVFNDYVANYSINVLQKLGKAVPDDISVFGFSDEPVASYMSPQLSTVASVASKMGLLACQKMISILHKNEPLTNEKIVINPELVIRETSNLH